MTRKGFGYARAEADPILYHGVPRFDPAVGIVSKAAGKPSYTQVFGDWLCDMAARDPRLVCITPAMREGSGLVRFSGEYPNRYFDVGIAEQHAVTFAAGLACEGMKPVVAIYSTFLQRAYDQLIHDVALQNLPILFAMDRAGVVGPDGATHNGAFDLSYLRCLPNMVVMAPADENECRQMLYTGFTFDRPVAVRYPRGSGPGVPVAAAMTALPLGKAEVRRQSKKSHNRLAILAFGSMLQQALLAGESIDATVVNMRFVKPLDAELILRLASEHAAFITVEENVVAGGAGSAVAEALAKAGVTLPVLHLGLPDTFTDHGDPAQILRDCGLDAAGIASAIDRRFGKSRVVSFPKPAA
jgi:1-deoxy-D-xylulose-5-phosphate synthase